MRRWMYAFVAALVATFVLSAGPVRRAQADSLPSITVGLASVIEGDAGSATVEVPIDLAAPTSVPVTVSYVIEGGTATAGSDFYARKGKVSFTVGGSVSKFISVKVYGDTLPEPDETVLVELSNPVNATLANSEGVVTIVDDDSDANTGLQTSVGDLTVEEANAGTHYAYLPVTLSRPAPSTVKVYYAISCSSAVEGVDYQTKNTGTLTFLTGQQTKQLRFKIDADLMPEDTKSILDTIKVTSGPAVVNQGRGDTTIVDNDTSGGTNAIGLAVGEIKRASVASDGTEADSASTLCGSGPFQWGSLDETMSGNGRYVAFVSDASNLVPNDTNGDIDTFVKDLVTGETERVSVHTDGSEFVNTYSSVNPWQTAFDSPSISADGRFVTFTDEYGGKIYLRDRVAQTTELISVNADGSVPGDWPSNDTSSVSADGRYVAFESIQTGLVTPLAPANGQHVYLRDRVAHTTRLVTTLGTSPTVGGSSQFGGVKISADGRYIILQDTDGSLVAGDTNQCVDTFVYDIANGTFERDSVDSNGNAQTDGCTDYSGSPVISSDGRYVGFGSASRSLAGAAPTDPLVGHVYIHDRLTGTTTRIDDPSVVSPGTTASLYGISDDGQYATWSCEACANGDPVPAYPTINDDAAYWVNLQTGETVQIGMIDGNPPTNDDTNGRTLTNAQGMSADGSTVAFHTWATNLIPDDTNGKLDVYVERLR